jgi:decaprenylphospho-beta-D-ribofuranose 2-oxidase
MEGVGSRSGSDADHCSSFRGTAARLAMAQSADYRMASSRLVSFDAGVSARVAVQRPDRYRHLEAAWSDGRPRIVRGGGYSYAAASFDTDTVTIDMRRFDRILAFDPASRRIKVEAGLTLGRLLAFTTERGLWITQIPGYPDITVGGAIAANVQGKGAFRAGTFRHAVVDVTLFHPDLGWMTLSRDQSPSVFELTLGGFGLTGVIVSATLQLEPLPGHEVSMRVSPLTALSEGFARMRERAEHCDFAYTWHDAAPSAASFGRGLLVEGEVIAGARPAGGFEPRYKILSPCGDQGRLPIALWGGPMTGLINGAFRALNRLQPSRRRETLFESLFPFARSSMYFRLFGTRGLMESQILLRLPDADPFLAELESRVRKHRPPAIFISLKMMRGEESYLRFERHGLCVTVNMVRSGAGYDFASVLDELTERFDGLPSIIKDSRLPKSAVEKCYAGTGAFRTELRAFDPARRFRSELSRRLDL